MGEGEGPEFNPDPLTIKPNCQLTLKGDWIGYQYITYPVKDKTNKRNKNENSNKDTIMKTLTLSNIIYRGRE
jgi:hypothetical protein